MPFSIAWSLGGTRGSGGELDLASFYPGLPMPMYGSAGMHGMPPLPYMPPAPPPQSPRDVHSVQGEREHAQKQADENNFAQQLQSKSYFKVL